MTVLARAQATEKAAERHKYTRVGGKCKKEKKGFNGYTGKVGNPALELALAAKEEEARVAKDAAAGTADSARSQQYFVMQPTAADDAEAWEAANGAAKPLSPLKGFANIPSSGIIGYERPEPGSERWRPDPNTTAGALDVAAVADEVQPVDCSRPAARARIHPGAATSPDPRVHAHRRSGRSRTSTEARFDSRCASRSKRTCSTRGRHAPARVPSAAQRAAAAARLLSKTQIILFTVAVFGTPMLPCWCTPTSG